MRRLLLGYAERELELSARPTRIESTFEVERDRSHLRRRLDVGEIVQPYTSAAQYDSARQDVQ